MRKKLSKGYKLFVQCAHCGKVTKGGRQPAHGDGTFWHPRRHINGRGDCPGNVMEGIISESGNVVPSVSLREEPQERVEVVIAQMMKEIVTLFDESPGTIEAHLKQHYNISRK